MKLVLGWHAACVCHYVARSADNSIGSWVVQAAWMAVREHLRQELVGQPRRLDASGVDEAGSDIAATPVEAQTPRDGIADGARFEGYLPRRTEVQGDLRNVPLGSRDHDEQPQAGRHRQ